MTDENAPVNPAANPALDQDGERQPSDEASVAAALDRSRPLDVHRWSDFPEADAFVDKVYALCGGTPTMIQRKHFKVVVLDLYVAWICDPDLKISVSMSRALKLLERDWRRCHRHRSPG